MVKTSALGSGRPEVPPQIHPLQLWAVEGVLQPGASVTPLVSGGERGVPLMEPRPILTALCSPTSLGLSWLGCGSLRQLRAASQRHLDEP